MGFHLELRRPRLTLSCEVELSSDFSIAVLDAAVIEALVLLPSLNNSQGNTGVVPRTVTGDINIHMLHHSEVLMSRWKKKIKSPALLFSANELAEVQGPHPHQLII
jgi:hypothetical protein